MRGQFIFLCQDFCEKYYLQICGDTWFWNIKGTVMHCFFQEFRCTCKQVGIVVIFTCATILWLTFKLWVSWIKARVYGSKVILEKRETVKSTFFNTFQSESTAFVGLVFKMISHTFQIDKQTKQIYIFVYMEKIFSPNCCQYVTHHTTNRSCKYNGGTKAKNGFLSLKQL